MFLILGYFLPFYPPNNPKNQNFEKMKKTPGDIIILHKCTKNYDQMMYSSWDMVRDRCNYFSFWAIFCPFTPLTAWKIKILKKWKKHLEIASFYICVPKITIRWCKVPEIWCATDRWTDGKSDIQRWVPHLKAQNVNVPHQPNVITFNLKFLSTSAPLKETINITLDRIYHQREINTSISKKNMHNLLLCTKTVYFCFNGKIY